MNPVDVSFFNSVLVTSHPFFCRKESPYETFLKKMITISETVFSLPGTKSYVEEPWQFTIEWKENYFSTATYILFWSLFTHVMLYHSKTFSIFTLGMCAIPKIYNRYTKQNYIDFEFSKFDKSPINGMLEIINTKSEAKITDLGLINLIKHYIKLEKYQEAIKIYERKWDEIKNKKAVRSELISCYLKMGNPEAAEKILVPDHAKSKAYTLGLDLISIFKYYLNIKQPEKAKSLLNKLPADPSASLFLNECLLELVKYYLEEKKSDVAISVISVMDSSRFPHKGIAQINLAEFFLANGETDKADKWIAKIEVNECVKSHLEEYRKKRQLIEK